MVVKRAVQIVDTEESNKDILAYRVLRASARTLFLHLLDMPVWRPPTRKQLKATYADNYRYVLRLIHVYMEHVKLALVKHRQPALALWLTSQPQFNMYRALTPEFCQRMSCICQWWIMLKRGPVASTL